MTMKKVKFFPISSSRRRPGSSDFEYFWTPAFVGVTGFGTFYGFIFSFSEKKSDKTLHDTWKFRLDNTQNGNR